MFLAKSLKLALGSDRAMFSRKSSSHLGKPLFYSITWNWFLMTVNVSYISLFVCLVLKFLLDHGSSKQLRVYVNCCSWTTEPITIPIEKCLKGAFKCITLKFWTNEWLHLYQTQSLSNCWSLHPQYAFGLQFCFTTDICASQFSHHE